MFRAMTVIDDFYDDPHEVRRIALDFDYPVPERKKNYPGRNSLQRLVPKGMDDTLSRILGEPVQGLVNDLSPHCRFRVTLNDEKASYGVHADPTGLLWVGVIYLTLPEDCQGGTAFFRHKGLGLERTPSRPEQLTPFGVDSLEAFIAQEGGQAERWDHLMTIPMQFNRLILYRPWVWHSALPGFGDRSENARLIQVIACVPGAAP